MKKIGPGSSFFSLLSMLDILMGVPSMFKTVSLRALEPCTVAKFPIRTFRDSYQKLPEVWIRPIQIVITRLLHVTMTTLHQYMGLSSELMKRVGGFKCLKLLFFVFKGSLFKFFFFCCYFWRKIWTSRDETKSEWRSECDIRPVNSFCKRRPACDSSWRTEKAASQSPKICGR